MSSARVWSATLAGPTGCLVTLEASSEDGPPGMVLTGFPDDCARERADRIRAAVINSAEPWPSSALRVRALAEEGVAPGTGTDLAVADAVLAASGTAPLTWLDETVFMAELTLDGQLRAVTGAMPALARIPGYGRMLVVANADEAALVPGLEVITARSLSQVTAWLREDWPSPGPIGASS
jgi:magnesium chelatase family protein